MNVRRWLILFLLLLIAGFSVYFYSYYQRARKQRLAEFARGSAASLFLSGPYNAVSASTVTVTATVTSTATSTNRRADTWRDSSYPSFSRVTQKYGIPIDRVRHFAARNSYVAAEGSAVAPRVEMEEVFVQTITSSEGTQVNQMFDKLTGELQSERWQDPLLGEVVKSYHPEQATVSVRTSSPQLKMDFTPVPAEGAEYLTVQEPEQGFVSVQEGGRRMEYWANLKENRFVEFRDGEPSRQWRRVGENRFQEIDERGQPLSVYRVDPDNGGIVLAE